MATDAVYNYMKAENKPHNLNDILANVDNKYGKTVIQKAVDKLVADNKLFEKIYSKQKIYCVVQDSTCNTDESLRIEKEAQCREKENRYKEILKETKELEGILSSLKSSLTLEDAQKEKVTLQQDIKQLTRKLDELMESSNTVDLHDHSVSKRKAQDTLDENTRTYLKRKKIVTEILDCILDNYPGSKDKLYDEIGIDSTT
ncbi:homologous-pairing protein 2 homolog [Nylanderia fulva]|uniref:homologous-pairing protein 2 homolog n=1 Tax=Nylanderia fulva TaxID=613905 RepID=UPI0010FBB2DA|nr:homologous-pairing protein 2 homolog [Nylanderia fulva]XP_029176986.1 homologous-pairing protein 2 homolog [Nylanderia fulva]XP_029176987.1 homologous-pairing protein 2 homolog [Nylanderia fulva]